MNYIDILKDDRVIDEYAKIDVVNPFCFHHGLKHVKNVCKIMDRLCELLDIDGEEKEALLIASALHDIGQADGREEHGRKAKEFLVKNFGEELKDQKYYGEILEAIESHDDPCSADNTLFTLLVQFCDKMDFSKERLIDNYKDKFRYHCHEEIEKINFIYDDKVFGLDLITKDIENFTELFFKENFTPRVINALEALSKKLDRKIILLNNGKTMV